MSTPHRQSKPIIPAVLALGLLALAATACSSPASDRVSTTGVPPSTTSASTGSITTLAPSGYVDFPSIGLATVLPSGWVLEQEMNRRGTAAMLYDAGDTAALVVLGRSTELDEPFEAGDPAGAVVEIARFFAADWFGEGQATVGVEAAVVIGTDAATAQVRLDHEDGTHTITRATVVDVEGERVYVVLGYQGAFPQERIDQGLEVLDRLALLP